MHWLVADFGVLDKESLLAFDLASEKFKLYTMPVSPDFDHVMELKIKYFDTIPVTA
mgnify:CR=1 FL=1